MESLKTTNQPDQRHKSGLSGLVINHDPIAKWVCDQQTGAVLASNAAFDELFNELVSGAPTMRLADILLEPEVVQQITKRLHRDGVINATTALANCGPERGTRIKMAAATGELDGTAMDVFTVLEVLDDEDDAQIRQARDTLRDAIESLSEGFALYDDDSRLVMCNQRYREMNQGVADLLEPGLDWEILIRETARRGIYKDAIGREESWVNDRLENGIQYIQDFELNQTDGSSYLVSVHPTNLGGFVVTRTDITDRKQAEAVEREGGRLVRHVLDASPTAVVMAVIDSGEIIYRSPAAFELFGKARSIREFFQSTADRADFITSILADGQVDDLKITLRDAGGTLFPALLFGRIAEYRGDEVVVTTIIDLTEQQKTEALIKQVLEACQVPIQMTRAATGDILFSTSEARALFGQVANSKGYYLSENDRPALVEVLRKKGWYRDRRAQLRGAGGRVFWSSQSARLLEFNGDEVIVSNTRDLTDELALQEELENQRNMLFQNEKMSALGELLAGVAHELNNPLSVVVGHALMMRDEITEPDLLRRVDKISTAAERCAKIVKTFLAMARQQPAKMERTDISAVIATAVDVASYGRQNEDLQITQELNQRLPAIMADADQITQVIINLVINAEQAIKKSATGDQIRVSTRLGSDARSIEIRIEDNGPGIPEKLRGRIFEPFFTTKDVGDGTGIGLAFCHRIIHSHGGHIWHEPAAGQGARFVISLPFAKAEQISEDQTIAAPDAAKARRALVVDDEPEVAELIVEILTKDGFAVDYASAGDIALNHLAERRYDLVLSDLNMPDVDGRAMYEAIKTKHPRLLHRTGFVTGDTMGPASQALLKEAGLPHLEKPVSPTELRQLVSSILANAENNP